MSDVRKGQLRVPTEPSPYRVIDTIEERMTREYDRAVDGIVAGIERVLGSALGIVKSEGIYVVPNVPREQRQEALYKALAAATPAPIPLTEEVPKPLAPTLAAVPSPAAPEPEELKWDSQNVPGSPITHTAKMSHGTYTSTEKHGKHTLSYQPKGHNTKMHLGMHDSLHNVSQVVAQHHATNKDRKDVKFPGSKGGKWYRDDKGHVRYGLKPSKRFHTPVGDDEIASLPQHVWSLWWSSSKFLEDAIQPNTTLKPQDFEVIKAVSEKVKESSLDPKEAFAAVMADGFTVGKASKEAIVKKFEEIQQQLNNAVVHPKVAKAMHEALVQHAKYIKTLHAEFESTGSVLKGLLHDSLGLPADEAALKFLAGASDINLVGIPVSAKDFVDTKDKKNKNKWYGKLYVSGDKLELMSDAFDQLGPEHSIIHAIFAKLKEGGNEPSIFETDGKPDYHKIPGYQKVFGKYVAEHHPDKDLSFDEKKIIANKWAEIASKMAGYLKEYDKGAGGGVVGMILAAPSDKLSKVIKDPEGAKKLAEEDLAHQKLIEAAVAAQATTEVSPEFGFSNKLSKDFKLFDYQKPFVNWMLTVKRGINAAFPGAGKTAMAIAAVDHLIHSGKEKRGVFVLPPALLLQWPTEIEKFRPGSKVISLHGYSSENRLRVIEAINRGEVECEFLLMSAGTIGEVIDDPKKSLPKDAFDAEGNLKDENLLPTVQELVKTDRLTQALRKMQGAMFVDEAHSPVTGLKNPKNRKHIVAKEALGDREHAWGLTATPQANSPADTYHLMEFFHPGSAGGNLHKFMGKVATWTADEDGKVSMDGWDNIADLHDSIKPFVYHKSMFDKDVQESLTKMGKPLPGIDNKLRYLKMSDEQEKFYMKAATEVINDLEGGRTLNALSRMTQLRQAAIHPGLLDKPGETDPETGQPFPKYTGRGVKIDWTVQRAIDHLKDPANRKKPLAIFCEFSKAFDILEDELNKAGIPSSLIGRIDKSVASQKHRAAFQEAYNDGNLPIILVGMKAGGAGLNLQGKKGGATAENMIFLDKPWSPSMVEQAAGRVPRPGSTATTVTADHLCIGGTYDDVISEALTQKLAVAKGVAIANQGEEVVKQKTLAAILNLVGQKTKGAIEKKKKGVTLEADMTPEQKVMLQEEMAKLGAPKDPAKLQDWIKKEFEIEAAIGKKEARKKRMLPYLHRVKEQAYLQGGKSKLDVKEILNNLDLKDKKIDKEEHGKRHAKIQLEKKQWEDSVAAGKEIPWAVWNKGAGTKIATPDTPTPKEEAEAAKAPAAPKAAAAPKAPKAAKPKAEAKPVAPAKPKANPYHPKKDSITHAFYSHFVQHQPSSPQEWAVKIEKETKEDKKTSLEWANEYWKKFKKDGLIEKSLVEATAIWVRRFL